MEFLKPLSLNKIWARFGAIVTPNDNKIAQGHIIEQPAHQIANFLNNRTDQAIAHINQRGIPEWDAITEYLANKSWTQGSNGAIYFCKVTGTNLNPVTDVAQTYWTKVLDGRVVVTAPEISAYIRTLLDDPDAYTARQTLGFTTVGQNLVTSLTELAARQNLGVGNTGNLLFISPSQLDARQNVLGITSASDITEGLVQRATDNESISGINDTKFLTPRKLKLGFSVSLATNGFIKFPSWLAGFEVRWGRVTLNGGTVQPNVTTFTTQCLAATAIVYSNTTSGGDGAMSCLPVGATLTVVNQETSQRLIGWIALGY